MRLPAGVFAEYIHLKSDVFTKLGLPVPIIEVFSESLAGDLYKSQYDSLCLLRDLKIVGKQAGFSILINMIIGLVHGLLYDPQKDGDRKLYEVRTRKILSISNSLASAGNIAYAIGTEDWRKLDVGGILVTLYQMCIRDSRKDKEEIEKQASELEDKANQSELSWAHNMSYHLNGVMLDTMAHEFAIRFPNLPDSVKLDFDGTLLCQLAEDGNHVVKVALNLVCGFVDDATTIAQTHGGGGGSPGSGWGKRPDEDDREWARRCLAMARKMCAPSVGRRKKM